MSDPLLTTLDDVSEFIVDCLHATAPTEDDGYPLIRTPNIGYGRFDLNGVQRVSQATYETWTQRAVPQPGDLILAREAPAGNVAIVLEGQQPCLGQRTVHIRPDRTKVDPSFLCYFLLAPAQRGLLLAAETGATAKHINMRDIRRLPLVGLPALQDQQRIGAALTDYDDLIDNNRRRIKLLEDSVRLLFDEWFVRRRVPYATAATQSTDLPRGCSREPLGRLTTKIGSGATPRGGDASYAEEGIALIRSQNVYDYNFVEDGLAHINDDQAALLSGVSVEAEDVLLNITGASVGRCCMVPRPLIPARVNQHVMIIRADPRKVSPYYLLCAINSDERKRQLLSYAQTGSTREALTKELMSNFEVIVPDELNMRAFAEFAGDVFQQREELAEQNVKLRAARDLLLPRLMSGELTV